MDCGGLMDFRENSSFCFQRRLSTSSTLYEEGLDCYSWVSEVFAFLEEFVEMKPVDTAKISLTLFALSSLLNNLPPHKNMIFIIQVSNLRCLLAQLGSIMLLVDKHQSDSYLMIMCFLLKRLCISLTEFGWILDKLNRLGNF